MDATTAKGLWLLPTKSHAHDRLPTFLKWAIKAKTSTPGYILVEWDDFRSNKTAYDALEMPTNWEVIVAEGACTGEVSEWAYRNYCRDMDWIGWVTDDQRPITEEWDRRAIANLTGSNWVSTDDGVFAPKRANGALVFSGDYLRAIGWLYPPGLHHFYFDDVHEEIGKITGTWTVDMSILLQHDHDMVTGRMDSLTSVKNSFWPNDVPAFQRLKTDGTITAAAERIIAMLASKGATIARHDATGVKLMLAVPSADRRYEGIWVNSYVATRDAVRQFGGEVILAEMPYSPVEFARNKLLGHFYRSNCTNLLWTDDDQGWPAAAVLKMLGYKKDFVAVAGVRKTFPPSFGVGSQDDDGQPLPIRVDSETGLLEPSRVGMALCLLSRNCAERMIQSYPELSYRTADGQDEVGVFMPLIVNRAYLNEDFAFCYRWKAIGGKVLVDGAISLDHIGPYVYSGSWLDHLNKMEDARQQAA